MFIISSLITNKCIGNYENHEEACHDEVVEIGKNRQYVLREFMTRMVKEVAKKIRNESK